MNYTELDLAYIAGLFDGEGNINIRCRTLKNGGLTYALVIHVANTNGPVIEYVQDRLGGSCYTRENFTVNRKTLYDLKWSSRSAQEVLGLLLPYLIIKKMQAEIAIAFQDIVNNKIVPNAPLGELELEIEGILHKRSKELIKGKQEIYHIRGGLPCQRKI